ncbi:MAG: RHS repeat-associated core domain-containing protein [Pseudomonas alloputida]|uniref:RHS repeat-associated core domain-containing protein n=1 Tax=Pseudomonas putida TaxID=303 RepID=A0AAW5HD74_PSEPU|nr:RHS repeat-associated core domain-containing protein [Pseudomonas putida]MCO1620154.1 RHS repeat-associated core domain-containing protein [Pseudomonas putida]
MSASEPRRSQALLFYQSGQLVCVLDNGSERLVQAAGHVLFQHGASPALLLTDGANSVNGVLRDQQLLREVYSPYGYSSSGAAASLVGFNGEWQDPIGKAYPLGNGHRFYMPSLRRFNRADKKSPFDEGGMNAYVYCGGDPINHVDPTGQSWSALLGAARGFLNALSRRAIAAARRFYQQPAQNLRPPQAVPPLEVIDVPASLRQHNLPASLEPVVQQGFRQGVPVSIYTPDAQNGVNVVTYDTFGMGNQRVSVNEAAGGIYRGFAGQGVVVDASGIDGSLFRGDVRRTFAGPYGNYQYDELRFHLIRPVRTRGWGG